MAKKKWYDFVNPLTSRVKDKDIASGKVIVDWKNYRWRYK